MADYAPNYTNSPDDTLQSNRLVNRTSSMSGSSPSLRSCLTCRRRKVKCDKHLPCSNCVRGKIECVFPGPGRAPRRSRKPQDSELLERLRRLEGVVSSLNAQVEEHELEAAEQSRATPQDSARGQQSSYRSGRDNDSVRSGSTVDMDAGVEALGSRVDRLVVEKGRSRYIANGLWTSLNDEVEDLKSILVESSDDEGVNTPDSAHHSSQHQGFIFGYSSTNVDMHALRPTPDHACQYWEIYKESVEPLIKVLHIPTFEQTFHDAVSRPEKISKALEPLLFAIYYGAVTSSSEDDCIDRWGKDRTSLLKNYRFGLEQALARANFLYCNDIVVLQAFVIFLTLLRRNDNPHLIWTLLGLALRIAQTLGVHRDGTNFDLAPFEVEMRRRLWWQICALDQRSTEDHGISSVTAEMPFDAKMPLNVNDSDLDPNMLQLPEERQGFTDMTLSMVRYHLVLLFRQLSTTSSGKTGEKSTACFSIVEKEKHVNDWYKRMEDKYFKNSDMSVPLCWATATITRLVFSKLWLVIYHPIQRKDGGVTLPQQTKDKLFITSLENIECTITLESEPQAKKWRWHFRTFVQWHAIAFLLSELSIRTRGIAVERAWRALEMTATQWWGSLNDNSPNHKQGLVWKPIKRLFIKAKAARERELALEQASHAMQSGQSAYNNLSSLDSMQVPPVSTEQPSSEYLDSLLRPLGPGLGEYSAASPPGWPADTLPTESGTIGVAAQPHQMFRAGLNRTNGNPTDSGPAFHDLLKYGFDNLLVDVMDDMALDRGLVDTPSNLYPSFTSNLPQQPSIDNTISTHNMNFSNSTNDVNLARNMNSMNGTNPLIGRNHTTMFGNNMFPDVDLSPTMPNLDSPNTGGGNMDWTVWDDMLNQLGLEGQSGNQGSMPWL